VRETDRSLRLLIAKHASLRQQFEAALRTLATTVAKIAGMEADIDRLRQALFELQHTLKGDAVPLPPLGYR